MRSLIFTFLPFLFIFSLSFARKVENWSYERLFEEADLVMIGSVEGWGSTKALWPEKIFDKARFEGEKIHILTAFVRICWYTPATLSRYERRVHKQTL